MGTQYINIKHVFNTDQSVELLQSAFEEADKLRDLAWDRVSTAMLSDAPIKAGDLVRLENQYFPKNNGKILRVKNMYVRRDTWRKNVEWSVRAQLFPVKKNGAMALVGEHVIDDVIRKFAAGEIVLVPEIINTK